MNMEGGPGRDEGGYSSVPDVTSGPGTSLCNKGTYSNSRTASNMNAEKGILFL